MTRKTLALLLFVWGLLLGCTPTIPLPTETVSATATEQPVTIIPLVGDLTVSRAEVSGLAWYGDYLIVLPQYPDRFPSQEDGTLFALSKTDILAFLDGDSEGPLIPLTISFVAPGLADKIDGFEGYEAITFQDRQVFVTIEAKTRAGMRGYLVTGELAPDLSALHLDVDGLAEITPQADLGNMSYESLLLNGDELITLYEANGRGVNPQPTGRRFDTSLNPLTPVPFPSIEYRITDATVLDAAGRFWAINYFYPGDVKLRAPRDPLAERYGQGPTHARLATVERLVELHYDGEGIHLTSTPPLQLTLAQEARNWEGLVRLDGRGFLLMTDEHPETMLGFVPLPSAPEQREEE